MGSQSQSLKSWASRNAPNLKDKFLLISNKIPLVVKRGQTKLKVKDHSSLANLAYTIKDNGCASTLRTEENTDKFMDFIETLVPD